MGEFSVAPGTSAVGLDLTGRSALITGAASGIGRACAERLARAGAAVTVLDLNGDAAKQVAGEIGGEAMQADLSDYEVLDGLQVEADIVVNNAGLQHVAAVEDFPPERFSTILRVMLEAPFRIVRSALTGMYEKGVGACYQHLQRAWLARLAVQGGVHSGQARPGGSVEGRGPGGRSARRDVEHHLSGVRKHTACGGADRQPVQDPGDTGERSYREGNAYGTGDKTSHRARGGGRGGRVSLRSGGVDHQRRFPDDGRRRDGHVVSGKKRRKERKGKFK